MNTLRGKNFLSIMDLSKAELEWLIDEALYLKHQLDRGERHDELLKNKSFGMIFAHRQGLEPLSERSVDPDL